METIARLLTGIAVLAASLAVATSAGAQGGCQSEIDRFCSGEKQVLACLKKNEKDLSPGCLTYVGVFEQIPSCLAEAAKLCPTQQPTVSSVVGCLRGHESQLSPECKAEIAKVR